MCILAAALHWDQFLADKYFAWLGRQFWMLFVPCSFYSIMLCMLEMTFQSLIIACQRSRNKRFGWKWQNKKSCFSVAFCSILQNWPTTSSWFIVRLVQYKLIWRSFESLWILNFSDEYICDVFRTVVQLSLKSVAMLPSIPMVQKWTYNELFNISLI